jgi:hypothetical protein
LDKNGKYLVIDSAPDKQQDLSPIFIGGAGSTGSTLLSVMLDSHPKISCGPELSVFNKARFYEDFDTVRARLGTWLRKGLKTDGYFRYYRTFDNLSDYNLSAMDLTSRVQQAKDLREFSDWLMRHILQVRGKERFAEKTPSNAYCFHQLLSLYPNARLIHIFRDGRDVLCSWKRRGYSWFQGAGMWLYNTSAALRLEHDPRYFSLSYESLVANPESELRRLCSFLNIEYDPAMLQMGSERSQQKNRVKTWTVYPGKDPISTRSVGRYRRDLSDAGLFVFSRTRLTDTARRRLNTDISTTSDLMARLGYTDASLPHARVSHQVKARVELMSDRIYRHLQSIKHVEPLEVPLTTLYEPGVSPQSG